MSEKRILKNKVFLYLTEFFAGMSVMAVELGASRLLAPYFSSSQIVWTIIIGTIMIAMALGNIYGGRSADKNPNPDKLYGNDLLIWAAFFACMVIFVFPLFLLGTVTPSLAKYSVESLEESGKVVGNLGAFNTIGSIIGTFLPTFVTIPAVGTSITFLIFAGVLMLLGIIYFVSCRAGRVKSVVSVVILIISCIFGSSNSFAFWEKDLTYEGESIYNYLQVKENDEKVYLSTNVLFGVQSVYVKEEGLTGMYYDYAMAAPLMAGLSKKDGMNILILGMGTGTYATQCSRYYDDVVCTGVEIDEKITKLARQYFELTENVKVTTYDGRAYLNAIDEKYDVIMVDAYQDITIPFQMSSIEFFTPDGVMVVNMNMRGSSEGNINQYLSDTISQVFDQVYTVDVEGSTNRLLFASDNKTMMETFYDEVEVLSSDHALQDELKDFMEQKLEGHLMAYEAGSYIMTDDKAPVELLGMQVIDELIKDEVMYYKKIYEEEGLEGLLESL